MRSCRPSGRQRWQRYYDIGHLTHTHRNLVAAEFRRRFFCHSIYLAALSMLNERERRIFEGRRLAEEQITLAELAEEFGVSGERVRQIEVCAVEKVQKAVENRVAAIEVPETLPAA